LVAKNQLAGVVLPASDSSNPPFSANSIITGGVLELALDILELIAEEDTELSVDDREEIETAELDTIELTTDELEDLDPEPDPPPQAVRASKTVNKLQRLIFIVITLLWFFGNLASQPQARYLGAMQVALHLKGWLIVCVTICLVNRSPANGEAGATNRDAPFRILARDFKLSGTLRRKSYRNNQQRGIKIRVKLRAY